MIIIYKMFMCVTVSVCVHHVPYTIYSMLKTQSGQVLSQDLETGCLILAFLKFLASVLARI